MPRMTAFNASADSCIFLISSSESFCVNILRTPVESIRESELRHTSLIPYSPSWRVDTVMAVSEFPLKFFTM